ncbi:MAG: hypothetical protein ACU0E9_07880 [Limimaricola soesokkakensis]|uniref:hypothetical protein n=1 Tax=Limimaricola soesokkakensis TaxID=1343159 RepID=UPI00405A3DF5
MTQDPTPAPMAALPDPEAFRDWMRCALMVTGRTHTRTGRDLGFGRNTLRDFLGTPGRDLQLGTAAAVTRYLAEAAQAEGLALPPIGGAHG